jgi:predicted CopG family antitoxin
MNAIYGYADDIYEMLVDREFDSLKDVIEELMNELKDIQTSITDEI